LRPETVLAFDTSAAHCAAALLLPDGQVLSRLELMEKGQAERLMSLMQSLLADAGLNWRDVTRIAVGTGPGNFTGVRIAVAAARGLALGLGVPAIGVTRLEALAHGLPRPLTVIEDARRGEVYVQAFGTDEPEALVMDLSDLPLVVTTALVTGSAAGTPALPPAMSLAEATARIAAARHLPQPRPAPFYLRGADAAPPRDPAPLILSA
jgi:tRNA threonylcarbamoyladenosine biosynthesis protein TsaB